jgi:hypothetical protein
MIGIRNLFSTGLLDELQVIVDWEKGIYQSRFSVSLLTRSHYSYRQFTLSYGIFGTSIAQ